MTGNSGPYLLYSCVRAKKILARKSTDSANNARRVSMCDQRGALASEPRNDGRERSGERACIMAPERDLIKKLLEYRTVLDEAVSEFAPHKVASFLYELAQVFSRFYENCEVIGSDEESARLRLVELYLNTMTHGLGLLGINIPEKM